MVTLPASFLQRKNQILGIKQTTTPTSTSKISTATTKSVLPANFLARKQQILTPPIPTRPTVAPIEKKPILTPIVGNLGVGSNLPAYSQQMTATPEQNRVAMKAIDIIKNTRNAVNDGIAAAGTPLKIFFPTPAYAPEDIKDAKKLASEYEKSVNLKVNKVANQFSAGIYRGVSGGLIKPNVREAETIPEKIASGTGNLLGAYYSLVKIGSFVDKSLLPGKTLEKILSLSPQVVKYVVPIIKNATTFDIYGQLDPDTQNRAKKLFMDTITAIPFTLLGNIQKGVYKVPATFALGYSMAKAAGANTEDALINGSLLALLATTEALTSPRTKNINTRELSPEDIRAEVYKQNKQNTPQGKDLLKVANHAEQNNSMVRLTVNQVKSSILEDILGKRTSFTQVKVDYPKNPDVTKTSGTISSPTTGGTPSTPGMMIPPIAPGVVKPNVPPIVPPETKVTSPESLKTTKKKEVVLEVKTAEDLIKSKGYDPTSVDIIDNENFIVKNTSGNKAKLMEIPIEEFETPKFETAGTYKAGRKITDPIEVSIVDGKYKITDGANRFTQAIANGDKTILAVVEQSPKIEEKAQKIEKEEVSEVKLYNSNGNPVITGNPRFENKEMYGLKVGDQVNQIGVPGRNGKVTTSHSVQKFDTPVIYRGVVNNVPGLKGRHLAFEYTEKGEKYYLLYSPTAKDYMVTADPKKLTSRQYKAVFNKVGSKTTSPKAVEQAKKKPVVQKTVKKQAQKPKKLTLAPSKATTEKEAMKEASKAGVLNAINLGKGTYNKPTIGVPQIKIFISNPEFKTNPVMTYTEDGVLSFKGKKIEFSVYPQALNINAERLVPGDKVTINIEAFKKTKGIQQTRIYKDEKVYASVDQFADLKNISKQFEEGSSSNLRVIEMPEMVRLATQLMEGVPAIKRSRIRKNLGVPNGLFRGRGKGEIYLNPDIFKTPGQAAKTLAHEMGHLADYLPDHTMSRGNLIGRIATLNKFLRSTFSGHLTEQKIDELIRQRNDLREQRRELKDNDGVVSDKAADSRILTELKKVNAEIKKLRSGESISDPKIRKELRRLSRKWKPFDPKQNAEFTKYRYSPPELYADALSVLFNDPVMLETKAPKFFDAFFKYLDQKPEYKKAFLDLQTLLLAGDDQVMNLRLNDISKNYKEGNAAWLAKDAESRNKKFNIIGELNTNFINKDYNLTKKVNEAIKQGKSVDPEINPIFTQSGLNYLEGEVKNIIVDNYQKVHLYTSKIPQISITTDVSGKTETLSLNGWESLGMITQLERSMYERGEMANPGGYDPKTAKETLDALKSKYKLGDWKKLQKAKRLFRKGTMAINKLALDHGFRTPELSTELMANKTYATFQVLDYIDTYISSAIYKQTGTLKAVANPATATIMKAVSTVRAIFYNDAKNANLDFLTLVDPENVVPAKTRFNGKYKEPVESRDPDKVLVKTVRDGKVTGVYIDKDLDLIFNNTTETTLRSLGKLSKLLTGAGLYRPVFTSLNLGFQIFNFHKDFIRTWRNMPDETLGDVITSFPKLIIDYSKSIPSSWRAITNKPDNLIKEMENARIIGLTRNDVYGSPDALGEEYINKVFQKIGALPEVKQSLIRAVPGINIIPKFFDAVSLFGNFIERLPKVAVYSRLKKKVTTGGMSDKELAYYIRNYIGSPDFLNVGRITPVSNNLFLFSNAAKEGIRGDLNMAFRPKTKGAWWFKTLLGTILPKLLQFAGSIGLLGVLIKKMYDGASEYDKTNYNVIPLGLDKNGKTIYIRSPNDETGRFIGALTWKILNIFNEDNHQELVESLMDVFSIYSGQLPSLTPSIEGASALMTYLSGRNPYDNFRNRLIIPDTTFKAGFKYSFPVMLDWLKNSQGLTIILPSYTPEGEMTQLEKILNLPVLSNIINRFLKVSDYGKIEKANRITKEVSKESAIKTLEKREKTNAALKTYLAGEQTEKNYKDIAGQLVKDVLGHNPDMNNKEEVAQAKAIEKQFRFAVIAGSNPPEISNVVDATTNQAKAENLKILLDTVPPEKFAELLKMFVEEGVVTTDTLLKFGELMTKKETSFNFIKPAYAANKIAFTGSPRQEEVYNKMSNEWTTGEASYYNPTNPAETRPGTNGIGAYGRKVESGSVAFGNRVFHDRLKAGEKIYIQVKGFENVKTPYGMGIFRVDDTMNERYNQKGKFNIDFNPKDITPEQRKKGRYPIEFKIIDLEKKSKPVKTPNNKRYYA